MMPASYPDDPCLSPPAECDPSIRFFHDEGVLFITAAPNVPGYVLPPAFIAVWRDYADARPYVFARPIHSHTDVGHALLRLQAVLGVDLSQFTSQSAILADSVAWALAQPTDTTGWPAATRGTVVSVLGFDSSDISDSGALLSDDNHNGDLDGDGECTDPIGGGGVDVVFDFGNSSALGLEDFARELGLGIDCCDDENCCDDDDDCGTHEHCVDGECVADECDGDEDCPEGTHCENGECVDDACDDDGDCPVGQVCINGECEVECDDEGDCPLGDTCEEGVCEDCPGQCCDNGDCDDGNPCTIDLCRHGKCHHYPKNCDDGNPCTIDACNPETGGCTHTCKEDCSTCESETDGPGYCVECGCVPSDCALTLAAGPDPACAGGVVTLTLTAGCNPACDAMDWQVYADPSDAVAEWIDGAGGEWVCENAPSAITLHVRLDCDALGLVTFQAQGVSPRGEVCEAECSIHVNRCVDLDVDSNNDGFIDVENSELGTDDPIEAVAFSPTTPGKWLWVNNDDSDDNDVIDDDAADADHINGIYDLKDVFPLIIRSTPASMYPEGSRLFLSTTDSSLLRVFGCREGDCADVKLGPALPWRVDIGLSDEERTFGIEGVEGGADLRLRLELEDALGHLICFDEVVVTVVRVASLEWETYGDNTPLDTCPNNGGKRIFPDRVAYVDEGASSRSTVILRATIEPIVRDVSLYFRTWDIDDPFDQDNPGLPVVSAIDNNANGPDNTFGDLSSDPGVISESQLTDETGTARLELPVSLQPGNNYRGAVSCMFDGVDDDVVTQLDADTSLPPPPVRFSDMLTVWRQVWLDLDSMGSGTDVSLAGEIVGIDYNIPHNGDGRANLSVPEIGDPGRFEGGNLSVANGGSYTLLGNADDSMDHYFITSTLIAVGYLWHQATVTDDDTAILPRTPNADLTILSQKFRYCYVEFRENSATRDDNKAFTATLSADPDVVSQLALTDVDYMPDVDFWSSVILMCHQSHADLPGGTGSTSGPVSPADCDPDYRYHRHTGFSITGDTRMIFGFTTGLEANVSAIYLESIMDYIAQVADGQIPFHVPRTLGFMEPRVIAHELAHQMGCAGHIPGTLVSPWTSADLELNGTQIRYIRVGTYLASN